MHFVQPSSRAFPEQMRFAALALLCLAAPIFATWTDMCPQSANCPTIMMGVACQNPTMCAIVGGYSDTPMSVYYSKDGFNTFNLANMIEDSYMLMDIAIDTNGVGCTAGLGLGNNSALLYTTDVTDWQASKDFNFLVGQDINAFGNGEFGFVGTTNNFANTQGVLISQDGGKDWVAGNWPNSVSNITEARYGSFPSDQVLYVTGGTWPSNKLFDHADDCLPLTHKSCVRVPKTQLEVVQRVNALRAARAATAAGNGYNAFLTKSSDGGQTWTVQFSDYNNFYFNDISCIDTTHCFAVGEGFTDGNAPGARIYATTDGNTWNRVFFSTVSGASLMRVHTVSRTEAWAAGGNVVNGEAMGTFYHTTDGGKTWVLAGDVPFVGDVTSMTFTSSALGFAVGITEFQTSTVMQYTA
jgi:photosystem II stability/assembly factor-like uncharacterized protein